MGTLRGHNAGGGEMALRRFLRRAGIGSDSDTRELERAAQAGGRRRVRGLDTEGDVLVQGMPSSAAPLMTSSAADAAGEGFILHAFFHRTDFQIKNAF